jgi:CubicO group peptidase (beta-lactamase class C family)
MKTALLFSFLILCTMVFPQNTFTRIDSLFNQASRLDIFSGVVLIADKDNVQYLKAFGNLDWDKQSPNLTNTKFNIGSIGKLFTQILISQLIQEGKLNLSDNLEKIYPLYNNEDDKKITVKLLLTFSAGLGDYFMIEEFNMHPDKYRSTDALLSIIKKQPLLYEPGTSREYSNSSYVVLGGIIEKLTGKNYLENLKERILNPLEMNNSGFIYKDTKRTNTAKGYIVNPDGTKESTYERMPNVPTPAGGMFSTVEDLLKLDRSLMNDNVLLNDKYKVLLLNRFNADINSTFQELLAEPDFGMGVAGGSPGWNAVYDQIVAGKYTVIILSNFDQGAEKLIKNINGILLGKDISPLTPSAGKIIYAIIKEKGASYFVNNYLEVLKGIEIEDDGMLNMLGYNFLQGGKTDEAISVFIVNTKLFPEIANTFDSLGEAYLKKGNKELAIENYRKAFKMDPQNKNAEKIIKDLTGN